MHEHSPHTSDQPRSAPTPCFSSVVICSAEPQTKAQQNLLQEAESRGPDMCLLCLCHLITYTHSYFSQISFYMCVCACVHTWLFPFRVMLFALVITRLSHHLFVCLSACASVYVCVCVFVNVYVHFTCLHLKTSIVALNLEATHAQSLWVFFFCSL